MSNVTSAPANLVNPIREKIMAVLDLLRATGRTDLSRLTNKLIDAYYQLDPGSSRGTVLQAKLNLTLASAMLREIDAPHTASFVESAAGAVGSVHANMTD